MNDVDVRSLRYFLAVAHHGSYSQAALHLQITQPAVSRQILLIERALKVRLFVRDGRRSLLTEAGKTLRVHAQQIVDQTEALGHVVGPAAQQPSGRLNVGIPTATADYLMPEVLQNYRKKYPQVALHLVQSYGSDLCNQLGAGELDVALLYGNPRVPDIEMKGVIDLEMGLVCPPAGPAGRADPVKGLKSISLERAATLPLILPGGSQDLRRFIEEACLRQAVTPNILMEIDGISLTRTLVSQGVGYMFLAYSGVHADVERGTLRYVPVCEPALPWRLSLAVRAHKQETLATRAMMTEISTAIKRGVRNRSWRGALLDPL
ncbi:LysR family transcriptional regulator [Paraburkholderia sp. RP-4-7]|uniref:LysR family transcriptional regulator n=1 Tax=Paraburkholderia polaris TaxID=2728848 RepID=A0A848IS10_9BURK|nr:LysR family transcriptional regulator [Paraburkholderia polaris]NMM03893.1 LysR family transcriptional regulator [Paraburkholderia polaris]